MGDLAARRQSGSLRSWIFAMLLLEAFFIAISPIIAEISLGVGLLLWLIRLKRDPSSRYFRRLPFDLPLGIFVLIGAVSILVSPDKGFSLYNYSNLVLVYLFTYLLAGQNIRNRDDVIKLVKVLFASAAISVLYGFYQFVFGIDTVDMKWVDGDAFPWLRKRIFSTWINPNIFAGYLDIMIALAFGFMVKLRIDRRTRMIIAACIVAMAACLAMTYARGAFLVMAFVLICYGLLRDWRILLGCLAVIALAFAIEPSFFERISSAFTHMDTSMEMRTALWESTVAMIEDHPFLGIGWGAYYLVYPDYNFYLQDDSVYHIVHGHSMYLNYAAEIGIAGALAFFWYLFGTMLMAFRSKAHDVQGFTDGLMLGVGLALATVALNGIPDDLLFNFPSSMLLWLICAMAAAVHTNWNKSVSDMAMDNDKQSDVKANVVELFSDDDSIESNVLSVNTSSDQLASSDDNAIEEDKTSPGLDEIQDDVKDPSDGDAHEDISSNDSNDIEDDNLLKNKTAEELSSDNEPVDGLTDKDIMPDENGQKEG